MREIKFRGKRIDNGEWVYGFYHNETSIESHSSERERTMHHIYTQDFDVYVDPNTIGQYTGLKDKNGKEIYEGDIFIDQEEEVTSLVDFDEGCLYLKDYGFVERLVSDSAYSEFWEEFDRNPLYDFITKNMVVAGNIYDNPELLDME